jgi:hypothetical protein
MQPSKIKKVKSVCIHSVTVQVQTSKYTVIAPTRIWERLKMHTKLWSEYLKEIDQLGDLEHRNIIALTAYFVFYLWSEYLREIDQLGDLEYRNIIALTAYFLFYLWSEYLKEIDQLGDLEHRNIIALTAYFSSTYLHWTNLRFTVPSASCP